MASCTQNARLTKIAVSATLAATVAMGTATLGPTRASAEDGTSEPEALVSETGGESQATPSAATEGSAYDPRTTEGTSAVRDQFWGTCWAQAAISTTESFMIHSGLEPTSVQFSVEDMLWWVHNDETGWVMFFREDSGYPPMSTGYLTTVGVRSEADIPYLGKPADFGKDDSKDMHPSNVYGEGENQLPANYGTAPVLYEITDVVFVKNPSPQEVKDLISRYGAVATSYQQTEENFDPTYSTDWSTGRYDETGEELSGSNHAVSVVGWDDSFPKERFMAIDGKQPEHDGAWLLKNSYGTAYGSDGGFSYVSYDDEYLFKLSPDELHNYTYAVAGARKPVEQKRYMHDTYGAVSSWEPAGMSVCTWANVFDFGAEEKLNELSFVSWTKGGSYQMYYAPVTDGVPSTDETTWVPLSEGTIEHAGYTTVSAGWDAEVPAGSGAIVLRIAGDAPSIGTEAYLTNVRGKPLFVLSEAEARGKGYFLQDGGFAEASYTQGAAGYESAEYPILSIRAYTVPYEPAPEDEESGEEDPKPEDEKPEDEKPEQDDPTPAEDPTPEDKPSVEEPEPEQPSPSSDDPKPAETKPTKTTTSPKKTAAALPQTGDANTTIIAALALAGAALTALGLSKRRLQK